MKRFLCIAVALSMLLSAAALFSGCSGDSASKEYPVTIGSVTIDKEPENIVVLSDDLADIISYIGYDVKMVGRSIECDQEFLSVVPSVGSADNPSIDTITGYGTDLVLADDTLSDKSRQKLEAEGVPIISMVKAETMDELKVLYTNLGTVLGGNVTGHKNGEDAYEELISTIKSLRGTVSNDIVKTSAYLYIEQNGQLYTFPSGSIEATLFGYSGALNVFENQQGPAVNAEELRMATPSFIFCDSQEVIDYLNNDEALSNMTALKTDHVLIIPLSDFSRQGVTYEQIVYTMIDAMFVEHDASPDENAPEESRIQPGEIAGELE